LWYFEEGSDDVEVLLRETKITMSGTRGWKRKDPNALQNIWAGWLETV